MKKWFILIGMILLCISKISNAQVVTDTLTLRWEPSVWYGTYGQRTVCINDTLYHLGGWFKYGEPYGYSYSDHSFIEFKAPSNTYWEVDTVKLIGRTFINAEASDGKIYVLGGMKSWLGNCASEVEIYDPHSKTVTYGSPLPNPRRSAGSVLVNGKIYLIGGSRQSIYSDEVDIYDIATDTWTSGAPLPIATETEACYCNGKIYVIGGYSGSIHDEIFAYDILTNTWTLVGHTPYPVSAHKLASYQDYIFVIGDYIELNRIMRYRVTDGSWTVYHSNFFGRRHASTAISGNRLYILAGNSKLDEVYQHYRIVQSIDLLPLLTINEPDYRVPDKIELSQNYPNPFNPATTIEYDLSHSSEVQLTIYNALGQKIRTLVQSRQPAGHYRIQWDGCDDAGNPVASGMYVDKLKTSTDSGKELIRTKKMLLIN